MIGDRSPCQLIGLQTTHNATLCRNRLTNHKHAKSHWQLEFLCVSCIWTWTDELNCGFFVHSPLFSSMTSLFSRDLQHIHGCLTLQLQTQVKWPSDTSHARDESKRWSTFAQDDVLEENPALVWHRDRWWPVLELWSGWWMAVYISFILCHLWFNTLPFQEVFNC